MLDLPGLRFRGLRFRSMSWKRAGDPQSLINIAATRAVDRESNYNCDLNFGLLGSGFSKDAARP